MSFSQIKMAELIYVNGWKICMNNSLMKNSIIILKVIIEIVIYENLIFMLQW